MVGRGLRSGVLNGIILPIFFVILKKWLERTPGLDKDCFNFWRKFQDAAQTMIDDIRQSAEVIIMTEKCNNL